MEYPTCAPAPLIMPCTGICGICTRHHSSPAPCPPAPCTRHILIRHPVWLYFNMPTMWRICPPVGTRHPCTPSPPYFNTETPENKKSGYPFGYPACCGLYTPMYLAVSLANAAPAFSAIACSSAAFALRIAIAASVSISIASHAHRTACMYCLAV